MERKHLFAPWRMKYLDGPPLSGCFLCDAFGHDPSEETLLLVKSDRSGIVVNRYPYNTGHIMVAPRKHVDSLSALDPEDLSDLALWLKTAEMILRETYHPDGFNIGINIGSAAGAGLADHLHIHIMPRWKGDTNFITTCGGVRVIPEVAGETYRRLVRLFSETGGKPYR